MWFDRELSEYQLIPYAGTTTESLNKPTFDEHGRGIGYGRAGDGQCLR